MEGLLEATAVLTRYCWKVVALEAKRVVLEAMAELEYCLAQLVGEGL